MNTAPDVTLAIDILGRTPGVLRAQLAGAGDAMVHANEGPDTFSPFDVVGHLIDGEETDWMTRARIILEQGEQRTFEPYDRFRHQSRNVGRSIDSLLDEFTTLRAANLTALESWSLTAKQLSLEAQHPALGTVTLQQLLAAWVVHDLGHIAQVVRVIAKQHRDAVGPWRAYLPVLDDRPKPAS